jgi:hypothetical protein
MKKRIVIGALAAMLVCCVLAIVGILPLRSCIHLGNSGPLDRADSYEQVKQALVERTDIIYFDISEYDENDFDFWVYQIPPDGRPKTGYSLGADTHSVARLKKTGKESVLSIVSLRCFNEELMSASLGDLWLPLDTNTVYRGIPMEAKIADKTDAYNDEESDEYDGSSPYPKGTRVFWLKREFFFNGYRYKITATLKIPPERIGKVDIEEEKAAANAEVEGFVDNILDQGGTSR